jgi:hypothetical protein
LIFYCLVVFGKVLEGMDIVKAIEKVGSGSGMYILLLCVYLNVFLCNHNM